MNAGEDLSSCKAFLGMRFEFPHDCDPRLRRFAEYLASKAPPDQLPRRQDIIVCEIPDLLPFPQLHDVLLQDNNQLRYRLRLIGTHVVDLFGEDPTGKFVDEFLLPDAAKAVSERYG